MKIAISVPDSLFADVESAVSRLGVSRSEFFATAGRRYLDELERGSLTQAVDEAVALVGATGTEGSRAAWMAGTARRAFDREPW